MKYLPFVDRAQGAAVNRQAWYNYFFSVSGYYPPLTNVSQYMYGVFRGDQGVNYLIVPDNQVQWLDPELHAPMLLDEIPEGTEEHEEAFEQFAPGEGIINPE
jgi:hypothetical protein